MSKLSLLEICGKFAEASNAYEPVAPSGPAASNVFDPIQP